METPLNIYLFDSEYNISMDHVSDELELENVNESESLLELPLDMRFNDGHRMAIVMYLTLMIAAAAGNVYVFFSIFRIRQQRGRLGRINLLLFNLTIADLLVTFIMMPLEIVWNATVSWLAGDLACRILSFCRVFGLYLSGFVTVCICLDRYFVIINPMTIYHAERRNRRLLLGAWICSAVCSLPQSFIFHVERHPKFQWYQQCITFNSFPSPEYELAYNLFGFGVMCAFPMLTIIYCYIRVFWRLRSITRQNRNENQLRRSNVRFLRRARTKTLKMAFITAVVFCICWMPYNIICLWYWFAKDSALKLDQRIQKTFFVFACTNSCLNPLIYGWYHMDGSRSGRNSKLVRSHCHRRDQLETLLGKANNVIIPLAEDDITLITPEPNKRRVEYLQRPCSTLVSQEGVIVRSRKASLNFEENLSRMLEGTYV